MGRGLSSVCMALCGIAGVLIAFNLITKAPGVLLGAVKSGTYDASFWGAIIADLIGAAVAIALIAAAFSLRRHINRLDAKIEEQESGEQPK